MNCWPGPGNIRELKNVVERALIMAPGGTIGKGIGLAVIHEILTRSGIRFSLTTGPDSITRFELFFR